MGLVSKLKQENVMEQQSTYSVSTTNVYTSGTSTPIATPAPAYIAPAPVATPAPVYMAPAPAYVAPVQVCNVSSHVDEKNHSQTNTSMFSQITQKILPQSAPQISSNSNSPNQSGINNMISQKITDCWNANKLYKFYNNEQIARIIHNA